MEKQKAAAKKRPLKERPTDERSPVVLFVDDDELTLDAHGRLLLGDPITVRTAPSGLHALEILATLPVAVVVSDYWMVGMNGVQLLGEVERLYPKTGRVLLSGMADSEIVVEAKRHKVLTKGMDPGLIRRVILREVRRYAAR